MNRRHKFMPFFDSRAAVRLAIKGGRDDHAQLIDQSCGKERTVDAAAFQQQTSDAEFAAEHIQHCCEIISLVPKMT